MVPCVIFEDDHLLAVNKPAGLNTHAPAPHAGEGIYDWLKHREPRWAALAIIHRLDKETSGVLVFAKTPLANRSLTAQFTERAVRKKYLFLTDRPLSRPEWTVKTNLARAGDRYLSSPRGEAAETRFRLVGSPDAVHLGTGIRHLASAILQAEPRTGRTHQIRVHAAESGCPVLGDVLYGGTPAPRVFLHAAELHLRHPATGAELHLTAPPDFAADARLALRRGLIDPTETNAFRLIHGAADGWPGWYVDQLSPHLLSQSARPLSPEQEDWLARALELRGHERPPAIPAVVDREGSTVESASFHKHLDRDVRHTQPGNASPQLIGGAPVAGPFTIRENGAQFELSFSEGYSVGLFLDQRDNRRRFLTGNVGAGFPLAPVGTEGGSRAHAGVERRKEQQAAGTCIPAKPLTGVTVLNTFAYTGGFSVCAALAGAHTTTLDLSKKYLDWARRNFALNGLDAARHEFIFGDAFDWLRRLAKKSRTFDVIALDPPTFSQSRACGVFRAVKDYGRLVAAALPVLNPGGVLFASSNTADWAPEDFLATVRTAIRSEGRKIERERYYPQPPDFPITREEPAYLKTVWLRLG